jgi:hypothetical protein
MSYSIDSWLDDKEVMLSYRLNDPNGTRSSEDAKRNIRICTIKENKAKPVIEADIKSRGENAKILDGGIDNSGEFIESDRDVRADPDWIIDYGTHKHLVEVCVHSERFKTVSFKISKLNKAIKLSGYIYVIRENYYLVYNSAACKLLLDTYEVQSVAKVFGGKPSIILDTHDVHTQVSMKIVHKYEYMTAAKKIISPILKELF